MFNYSDIIYKRLLLEYDRECFIKEYDEFILPNSPDIEALQIENYKLSRYLNSIWKMVPEDLYAKQCLGSPDPNDSAKRTIIRNEIPAWKIESLVFCPEDKQSAYNSWFGSIVFRNNNLSKDFVWKDQYKDLQIVKFIKHLPLTDIKMVRCFSLMPGSFVGIHRDSKLDSLSTNKIWDNGYISITLNLSNGGSPLWYMNEFSYDLSKVDLTKVYKSDDDLAFLFNDYYPHGVPIVNSIRRQIRITAKPTKEFQKYLRS